jgi:rod shape determining protein RodA
MPAFFQERLDLRIGLLMFALMAIGLVSIYSATYDAGASELSNKQLLWAGTGTMIFLIVIFLPIKFLHSIAYPSYFLCALLLVSVLLLGKTVSGSTSWFNLGTMRLQPSEFAKIATVFALASYLSRNEVTLQKFKHLVIAIVIVLLPVGLIMMQPDVGTAVIYIGMFLAVLYWGGASNFTLVAFVAPGVVAIAALFGTTPFLIAVVILSALLYLTREHRIVAAAMFSLMVLVGISVQFIYNGLKPYQQKRIAAFLDPNADPLGAGYNVLQSKVAIGSGGLLGKGYLQGTQTQLNFIPEQWTDFIFCVPGEEFGFLGAAVVLLLFMTLLLHGVNVGSTVKNRFSSLVAIGITAILGTHIVINIGMAVGLLPVIGVPLPFLSYGGSALLTNMTMVGILLNLYSNRKGY